MELKTARRMNHLKASEIREILKLAEKPEVISFAGGLPAPELFPVREIIEAGRLVLENDAARALQYTTTEGFAPLRARIASRMNARLGTDLSADQVLITHGSQQALDLAGKVFLDEGDVVLCESPTYLAAISAFRAYGCEFLEVPTDDEGMIIDRLDELLTSCPRARLIYVIPDFQNPTGRTWSLERRRRLAEVSARHGVAVIEDNPYGELRFRGEGGNSFGAYLGEQCCMMGTFSKVVSPGMRIGWICCRNAALRAKLTAYKMAMDLHTNIFCQMVLSEYLAENDLDTHIEKIKNLYQSKADLMMACMEKYFPQGVTFTKPEGGMFIWATMPEGIRGVDVQHAAMKKGVVVCAGDPFYEKQRGVRTMRINYSNSSDEAIDKGIRLLGEAIRELMA